MTPKKQTPQLAPEPTRESLGLEASVEKPAARVPAGLDYTERQAREYEGWHRELAQLMDAHGQAVAEAVAAGREAPKAEGAMREVLDLLARRVVGPGQLRRRR